MLSVDDSVLTPPGSQLQALLGRRLPKIELGATASASSAGYKMMKLGAKTSGRLWNGPSELRLLSQ